MQFSAYLYSLLTSQFTFDLLDAGQAGLQFFRQGFQQLVFGNTHGLGFIAQGVFGHYLVFAFAQQQANGGIVLLVLDLAIDGGEVEAQLLQMLWFECAALEFDHHIAAQLQVVEQQVDEEVVTTNFQMNLATNKGKARAQFQQKLGDVLDER